MPRDDEPDAHIIDAVYAAAAQPELWNDVLPLMQETMKSVASTFTLQRYDDGSASVGAEHGYDDGWTEIYPSEFAAHNPFLKSDSGFQLGASLTDSLFDARKDAKDRFERSYFFNEWVRPQGFRHAMGSALDFRDDRVLIFNYWREADAGPFTADDVERQDRLLPHLGRAAKLSERFDAIRNDLAVSQALQHRRACGILRLDGRGRVLALDEEASRIVDEGNVLSVRRGRPTAASPLHAAALQNLIEAARQPGLIGGRTFGSIAIGRGSARPPLMVELIALPKETSPLPNDDLGTAMVLLVRAPARRLHHEAERLQAFSRDYGLTAAEVKMLAATHDTHNLREAAAKAGVGYETARSHIRSIFAKTETRSQAELARLVADRMI